MPAAPRKPFYGSPSSRRQLKPYTQRQESRRIEREQSQPPVISKAEAISAALERAEVSDVSIFGKWEVKALPEVLRDGELPEGLASGFYEDSIGVVVATNQRVIFINKGLFGALKTADFEYGNITSVVASSGLIFGEIRIHVAGNVDRIDKLTGSEATKLADLIRGKIRQHSSGIPSFTAPMSIADEIAKFAKLRDDGLITDSEFDAQKARLLR